MSNKQNDEIIEAVKDGTIKMDKCRFGHDCTTDCFNTKECPCQDEHTCSMTNNPSGDEDDYHEHLQATQNWYYDNHK